MTRNYRDRVTSRGEEGPMLRLLYATARRLLDYAKFGGQRNRKKIVKAFPLLKTYELPCSLEQALAQPRVHSDSLFLLAQAIQQQAKKQSLRKWETSLQDIHHRPLPVLYQWLRGSSPATAHALIGDQGPITSTEATFSSHRHFWESICRHPSPIEEAAAIQDFLNSDSHPAPDLTMHDVLRAASRMKPGTAPGLDNWPPEAARFLSEEAAATLADLYNYIEHNHTWPRNLLRVKVALLVKPGTQGTRPSDWRPISVTSVWYRLYGQARLPLYLQYLLPHLPDSLLGGIAGRGPELALMQLLTAFERHGTDRPAPPLMGIALDASKCFDRVRWSGMWKLLQDWHLPGHLIRALASFYCTHQRHTVIRNRLDTTEWAVGAGLLQGCPLSVLCTVSLVATWHSSIEPPTSGQSYIDDRLLLSPDPHSLQAAWQQSETWNDQNGRTVNYDKSVCLSTEPLRLDLPIPQVRSFGYLGHDVRSGVSHRKHLQQRARKAALTATRISRLPHSVGSDLRSLLIRTVVGPQWAYGLLCGLTPQTAIRLVTQQIKKALWPARKQFHSWELALGIIVNPCQVSA